MASLFHPFRALGYITENLPFAIERRGTESFVTVSVGKAWQVYKCAKLTLAYVGPELPGTITALASRKDLTFAAVNGTIIECTRLHRSGQYKYDCGGIKQLLVLGDLLLSLSVDKLVVWKIGQYQEPENVLELGPQFRATCLAHPDTYLNKVVIGGAAGTMQLWNFITGKLLFSFRIAACAISCLAPSPATDVIGIGLSDGRAVLHNLQFDQRLASFENASGVGARSTMTLDGIEGKPKGIGGVTALSFRTGVGIPLMAAGGGAGVVTVWNLEEKRIHTIIRDAHDSRLQSLHFFPGEPRLMSSAADNSIKQWLLDSEDGSARLLRFRAGHSAPPSVLRHYGNGDRLLSAGQDRAFRVFSVIQDQQSRELSQGHLEKRAKKLRVNQEELRLPRVVALDACQVRERDWANVITAHAGDPVAYTWRLQKYSIGEHALAPLSSAKRDPDSLPPSPVTAVAISACGNFGIVATASGRIDRHNMQSGLHRGTYSRKDASGGHSNAHDGAIVGLSADSSNRHLISAGGDGWLRVWSFRDCQVVREIKIGSRPTRLAAHPGTALVAVACDDLILRMFDTETGQQVRSYRGHKDRVTDLVISADGRWLLSSSMDGTLRVSDIPSARTMQVMKLGAPVTSLSLAPNQELLATAHAGKRGIYLWANQYIFGGAADIQPSETPIHARLASHQAGFAEEDLEGESDSELSDSETDSDESQHDHTPANPSPTDAAGGEKQAVYQAKLPTGAPQPLLPKLVTLSLLPRTQWQNLVHLDAIRERSKPAEPPKKPEAAPFFLPTVASLKRDPVFDTEAAPAEQAAAAGDNPPGGSDAMPGWGGGEDDASQQGGEDGGEPKKRKPQASAGEKGRKKSRVVRRGPSQAQVTAFIALLREGAESGNYSELMQLLRGMSPVAVDEQLQLMRVVDPEAADPEEIQDLGRVLRFVEAELEEGRSFEHMQAFLRAFLNIHGETISEQPPLKQRAAALEEKLASVWLRLQSKLHHVRGLVNFLGNLPA